MYSGSSYSGNAHSITNEQDDIFGEFGFRHSLGNGFTAHVSVPLQSIMNVSESQFLPIIYICNEKLWVKTQVRKKIRQMTTKMS